MLTIQASGTESLWDEILPGGGQGSARRSRPPGRATQRPGVAGADRCAVGTAAGRDRGLARARASHDRDGELRALDDRQAPLRVGIRDVDAGGVGLAALAAVLSDRDDRAGAGRVDGSQVDPPVGAEVVHEITRELIQKARREKRSRPRAARIDSTVVEADVRWPTDSGLAGDGVKALAREGRKLATHVAEKRTAVRDRSLGDGSQAPRVDAHDPSSLGRGQARGARVDRADRTAPASIDQGGQNTRRYRAPARAWPRCTRETEGCEDLGGKPPTAARRSARRFVSGSRANRSRTG